VRECASKSAIPIQTVTYTYGNANWKDQLTAYNGIPICYDEIGNPLNDGTWQYAWQAGRQLKSMSKIGTNIEYVYNAEGLRVRKMVNGVNSNYILYGKNIVHMAQGTNSLHFFYDAQNRVTQVDFNGIRYGYLHNAHGDIIAIVDSSGGSVVEYVYDPWGKSISKAGTLASTLGTLNPFRYRGYVFDEETNLYYLRSRYYNPEWGRFISPDALLGRVGALLSHNAYAYCNNNPVNMQDVSGKTAKLIFAKNDVFHETVTKAM